MKRYGSIIGLTPEKILEYKNLHAAVWPEVLAMINSCNIRNYSIFCANQKTCCSLTLNITVMISQQTWCTWHRSQDDQS